MRLLEGGIGSVVELAAVNLISASSCASTAVITAQTALNGSVSFNILQCDILFLSFIEPHLQPEGFAWGPVLLLCFPVLLEHFLYNNSHAPIFAEDKNLLLAHRASYLPCTLGVPVVTCTCSLSMQVTRFSGSRSSPGGAYFRVTAPLILADIRCIKLA